MTSRSHIAVLAMLFMVSVALADPKQGPCLKTQDPSHQNTLACDNQQPNGCDGEITMHWTQRECQQETGPCQNSAQPLFTIFPPMAIEGDECNFQNQEFWACTGDTTKEQNFGNGSTCQ